MALQASYFPSSFSSSSFSNEWPYDVFLSFRGSDTCHGFTGNLYKALSAKGIHTFFDDQELQGGEEIPPALVKAIQDSRIAIVVFSVNYASSLFCLHVLATIMECVKGNGRLVLPVFYDVDPYDVRHQSGSYGEAMNQYEERFKDEKDKVQKWREALRDAANLSGENFTPGNEYEYAFIEKIVKVVSKKISRVPLHIADYPVGLVSRVLEVNSLLNDGFDCGVCMVGIYGIGGIGKTTLARAVYNFIADQFEGLCFLENVREKSIKFGLVHLQENLLSEILGDRDIKLGSVNQGVLIIKQRLHQKKVLLVLDDVDGLKQIQAIVGGANWLGSGSRVIITTRDKHLLTSHGIERTYKVEGLSKEEALELLGWNAFKDENIDPSYMDILKHVVTYACGLPLALEVIGSDLFGISKEEWRYTVAQYERIPNKEIQKRLQRSFDDLEEYNKKIFLDIVCCFNGYNWVEVQDILHACHDVFLEYGISALVEKSLLMFDKDGYMTILDLVRDMGREIVRQQSPKHPGNRSQLWIPIDVVQVLEENTGTDAIEIMILDAPKLEKIVVEWDGESFKKMRNLEVLIIRNTHLSQDAKHLPNSLRVLEWWNYPSNSLPSKFYPKELAILNLPGGSLMSLGFIKKRKFMNLKVLKLDKSNIEYAPDVSGLPNLETLSFRDCGNLVKVHESVGFLDKLSQLDISGCSKLRSFPALMLPCHAKLDFSGCSSLENFPEILGNMESLAYDVFVSFRGKDTHVTFSSLLHTSLEKAGISVFKDVDDDAHRRGEQMSIQQLKAMKMSRFCVIVLSRNYAASKWCLLELEHIIDCHKTKRQVVVPVFYDVDPEDVRNETGMIWEAFQDLVNRISVKEDRVRSWRDALREAGGILGFVVEDYSRNRGEDIKKVAECLTRWVNRTNLPVATHPVGVQESVQFLVEQLNMQKSEDVLLLGIWGMGGIGKTTFAKALYNQIGCEFEGSSFLLDIRKAWQRERHAALQERILSDIYLTRERRIHDIKSGKMRLEERLHDRKVLLVLDDVNKREQLDTFCGSHEWFGPGSIIIITTRDRRLLIDHRVDLIHTMKEMDESESIELFSWHAFKQASPRQDFAELCGNAVSYCGGLPLALSVLGSELFRKEMTKWKNVLDGLREVPHPVVQDVLRISFDDLNDDKERDLFLDISFFYIGISKDDVIVHALKGYGDSVESGITVLEDRSLVKVDENRKFEMHVLLREMGREILRDLFRIDPGPMVYDVFLSFRADTRASFTSHLYTYLQNAGCHVFKDDESLQKGDQISISMMQAIGRSRISIVVLSEKYPNSRWCMIELEKILECRRTTNQEAIPVFYNVRPSEVLNSGVPSEKRSMFREAFEELLRNISGDKDRKLGWKRALADISAIQGHPIANSRNESEDIKKVVADVTERLKMKYKKDLFVAKHPVGVESRVADVIRILDSHQEKDILVLGIWGMGAAGKTTIAKATYNKIGDNFEGRSFLRDVREVWKETNGQVSLQNKILFDIYQEMQIKIDDIDEGIIKLQERLPPKKILLVLDDVDDREQLDALCGSHGFFKKGSRIIITTTNQKLMTAAGEGEEKPQTGQSKVNYEIYPVEKMEESESIELFSWHAFKQATPKEKFHELSRDIVSYSGRLPLALKVLGSYFFDIGMELNDWKSTLGALKRIPHHEVQKKLRISFDDLSNKDVEDIFLDIAFFFIGMDQNDVIQILDGYRFSVKTAIRVLEDRSLITVRGNKIGMHNLLRDMGREIVREKYPEKPGKRSRLWDPNDVLHVLQRKVRKETRNIEGLALMSSKIVRVELSAFEMMEKLRFLQLDGAKLDGSFENMSRDLRWLYWRRFPSSHTPTGFDQGKIVAIELEQSNLKLMWEETQMLDELKILNLSHSHHLTKTPDFLYLPNLEKLSLEDCSELSYVSSTIGRLKKLKIINLKDCKKLRELPHRIYKVTSLQTLILSGCEKISKLEENLEQMKLLTTLEADGTGIGQMPCAVIRSKSIGKFSWRDWKGISRDVFPSMIIWSWTSPTNNVSSQMRRLTGLWTCLVSLIVPKSSFQGLFYIVSELPRLRSVRLECSSQFQISGDEALDTLNVELEPTTTTSLASNVNTSAFDDCRCQGDIFRSKYSLNFLLIQMGMQSPVTKILRESIFQACLCLYSINFILFFINLCL